MLWRVCAYSQTRLNLHSSPMRCDVISTESSCTGRLVSKPKFSSSFSFLRHAQLVFTSLIHATTEDIYFRGFLIPSDALILPDVDSVNHDSAIWGDPDVFRPSRYISKDNTLLNPEEYIAFFLGN